MSTESVLTYLGILIIVVLLSSNPSRDQVVTHGVGQGQVVVSCGGNISVLDKRVVKVSIEGSLDFGDVANCQTAKCQTVSEVSHRETSTTYHRQCRGH